MKSAYTSRNLATRNMRDPRHLMRFVKFQALTGTETERLTAIAKSEGVSASTVRESVRQIQSYREQNATLNVDLRINESILRVMPAFENSMSGLLTATELVEISDGKTGKKKVVTQEDKTTRLEASRIVKDIIVAKQPKAPLVENNLNQSNKVQVATLSVAETTEERMDRLRRKAAEENLLPAETAAVPGYLDRDEEKPSDDDDEGDEEDE
jgi:hypothetical protein